MDISWLKDIQIPDYSSILSSSSLNSTTVTLAAVTFSVIGGYVYYTQKYNFFSKQGIPGPTPLPIFGNALDFFIHLIPDLEMKNYKRYGKLFGSFEMSLPLLNISDPEVIKNIMVRDFGHFVDRRDRPSHYLTKHFLTALKGDEWRNARHTITPTFTSGKMKMMMSLMTECVDELMKSLGKKADSREDVNVKDTFGFYTMDVVAKCAFATTTNVQEIGYDSEFMSHASKFLSPSKLRIAIFMLLPRFVQMIFLKTGGGNTIGYLEKVVRNIIEQRKATGLSERSYKDLLQLMIDAMTSKTEEKEDSTATAVDTESHHVHEEASNNNHVANNGSTTNGTAHQGSKNSKTLSEDEVVANCLLVMAAGFETTATLLTYASYSLAMNQDKQDILRKEVRDAYESAGKTITYDCISSLKYLDAVISETLRMYPPATRIERQCTQDYPLTIDAHGRTYNLKIKKGDTVRFPIYAIHHDEKYYPNHEAFEPERFLPENKDKLTPYTYLPFGGGPRNCIGMRFALLEAKLALAKSVLNFRFVRCGQTPATPDYSRSGVLLSAHNMFVGVERL